MHPDGREMETADWHSAERALGLALYEEGDRLAIWLNANWEPSPGWLPPPREGHAWRRVLDSGEASFEEKEAGEAVTIPPRSVTVFSEQPERAPASP
jgi:pullulanase/glycogen debranching enzyme